MHDDQSGRSVGVAELHVGGINPTVGRDVLLYAVAATVIGGVSLFGGRGRVNGLLGGALALMVSLDAVRIRRGEA